MIISWIFLAVGMAMFLTVGFVLGFLSADRGYRRALLNICHFTGRMIGKAFVRTLNTRDVGALEQIDRQYSMLGTAEKLKRADPSALQAVRVFHDRLTQMFGAELLGLYFFGSRMRGNFMDWSDVDVAIYFDPAVPLARARRRIWREVLNILLQHGLLIQPRLANGPVVTASHPMLRRAVDTGILIG